MIAKPLIAVRDVPASSRWYQAVLGCDSGHGGPEYKQLMHHGAMVLQLHHGYAHGHPHIGDPALKPYGNGALFWLQADRFDVSIHATRRSDPPYLKARR